MRAELICTRITPKDADKKFHIRVHSSYSRPAILCVLFLIGISTALGQHRVDKRSLDAALKTVKDRSIAPLRFPTYFPFPPGSTAKEKRRTVYASVLADADSFELDLCFSRQTCHSAYFYAEISAEKITPRSEEPAYDRKLKLAKGITGYFSQSSCGASCAPESITWDEGEYRYTVFLEVSGNVNTITRFVNSAINNAGLNTDPPRTKAEEFASVDAFLKATLKSGDKKDLEANGDLNGDGLADWAGLIERKREPPFREKDMETDRTVQLYILLRRPEGNFAVSGRSKESGTFGIGSLYFEDLRIERSALYLQLNGGARYRSVSQFKLYKGEWRLIGWEEQEITSEPSDDVFKSSRKDRNLLTGTVIESRQTGDRTRIIRRTKKKFPRILLREFDLYGASELA